MTERPHGEADQPGASAPQPIAPEVSRRVGSILDSVEREAELCDHVRHDGRPLGLIVIDLDDFKAVNDTQGHEAGDALLCRVAVALAADLRPSDILGRLGGDEFAVLLPETGPEALHAAADRIGRQLRLVSAASLGLACLPEDGETAEELHRSADADLYRAKQKRAVAALV